MSQLITGGNGQLGRALRKYYPQAKYVDLAEFNISDANQVRDYDWGDVDTIINAAAYTQVDQAETPAGLVTAWQANAQGVANLASVAREKDLTLVHVSTDYVFDGTKKEPYTETDPINPKSVYGASKAAGDLAAQGVKKHYILRTSWVIGDGNNFVRTMLKLAKEHPELTVVNDQVGRPTFANDLAQAIHHLAGAGKQPGLYNFTNEGQPVSWADFARAIFATANLDCKVKDTSTAEYAANKDPWAERPANSILNLDKIKATELTIPDWQESLKNYIKNLEV